MTCLNFDIDIEPSMICIKLLKYFGILHITNAIKSKHTRIILKREQGSIIAIKVRKQDVDHPPASIG